MTLNKLHKKGSKDKPEKFENLSEQKPLETTKVPWWANFKKKGKENQTTTLEETTTEAYQLVSSSTNSSGPKDEIAGNIMRTTTKASRYVHHNSSTVFESGISANTIGKPLNVTGKLSPDELKYTEINS